MCLISNCVFSHFYYGGWKLKKSSTSPQFPICDKLKTELKVLIKSFAHPLYLFTPAPKMNSSQASENDIEEVWTLARMDGKQSSKQVRRSGAKVPGVTVMHGSTEIPTSTLPPGGRVESLATLSFHSRAEDGGCHPTAICCTLSRCWHLD